MDQNGALVKQYDKKIDSGMKWRIKSAGGGYVYLVSMCSTSGRVLGVPDTNSLTSVQLRNNDGSDLVKFKIIKHENGTYEILNKASNKCLAVYGDQQANDGNIVQNPYNMSGVDREWYIQSGSYEWSDVPTVNKNYYIESSYNSKFFDIPTKRNDAGAPLTQYSFNGEDNQKFKLVDCGSGYFKIQPLHSSDEKVLELSIVGSSYNLIINTSGSSYLQQFKFVKNSNGTYKIVNRQAGDGYVIEIPNSSNTLSDPLKMAYNTGAPGQNQQWVLKAISDMITSSATYNPNSNYNYLASTTDSRGKTTNYNYDVTKGTLESVTNANSVATNYTYDKNNDSLTAVAQSGVRVGYTYNKDKLSTITTGNNNVYSFGFDNFNRNTTVKIGSQTLITNIFDKRGLLSQSTYGNGQTLGYTYDLLDRVTEKKYNGEVKATYTYDNDGNVVRSTDKCVNTTTNNSFDVTNRLMSTSISKNNQIIQNIKFKYDDKNRVSDYTNTVAGVTTKTAFNYSNTSQINGVCSLQGNVTLSQKYTFDSLARLTKKNILINGAMYEGRITYLQGKTPGTTTNLIDTLDYGDIMLKYEYDKLGNIINIYENDSLKQSYTYDNLNQLKTEKTNGITITYNYDLGGNITSKTTISNLGSSTINYTYDNTNWKDLLTSYNGENITYDAIGNPLTYGSSTTFTWQNGRRLISLSKGSTNASYTYNVDGIRTQKKVNGIVTDYYLNGSSIVTQISGSNRFDFLYDENGNLYGFTYNNNIYAYLRNAQNDIIGIVDDGGCLVVTYDYDAWGNLTNLWDDSGIGLGSLNPFRYRGYYFDSESGYYYLQSRYYNPEWGRFINADGSVSTGQGLQGNNMFAYCGNNPVNNMDPSGNMYRGIPSFDPTFGLPSKITQPPYADTPQAIEETPSAEGNSSDGFLTEEQMHENATIVYNHLSDEGWSSNAICAVLGNMQTESYTINPGKRQDYGGPGYGLVQWDPASKYLDWAAANGYATNSLIGQVEYLSCTMKPGGGEWLPNNNSVPAGYGMTYSNFITSNENVGYLSLVFLYCYERAGVSHAVERQNNSIYWSNYFK